MKKVSLSALVLFLAICSIGWLTPGGWDSIRTLLGGDNIWTGKNTFTGSVSIGGTVSIDAEEEAEMDVGHIDWWIDEENNILHLKVKKSDGNVVDFQLQ